MKCKQFQGVSSLVHFSWFFPGQKTAAEVCTHLEQEQKCSWPAIVAVDQGSISSTLQSIHVHPLYFDFSFQWQTSQKDYKALQVEVQCFNKTADSQHSLQMDLFAKACSGSLIWLLTYMTTSSDACFFQACLYKHQDHAKLLPPV